MPSNVVHLHRTTVLDHTIVHDDGTTTQRVVEAPLVALELEDQRSADPSWMTPSRRTECDPSLPYGQDEQDLTDWPQSRRRVAKVLVFVATVAVIVAASLGMLEPVIAAVLEAGR